MLAGDRSPEPGVEDAVNFAGISRTFGFAPAVVNVSLRIGRGECVLIRGPNGAGKSTLLRIIATALSPTAGHGTVLGLDLIRDRNRIRTRSDLLGHRTRLYEDLTAAENLRFTAVVHGLDPGRRQTQEILERVGLSDVGGERVRGFSQGMRQRLAVGRLLLRDPELVLLDEPYAGLDREAQDLVDAIVMESRARGRTVVMVSHDAAKMALASRVVMMRSGRLRA